MSNKKKFKGFTGRKCCKSGEFYSFRKGKAQVPNFYMDGRPVYVTLKEFNELQKV